MGTFGGTLAAALALCVPAILAAQPRDIAGHRQLLFDDAYLERRHGLERTMHVAEKYDGNPIMVKEKPWEGSGPYVYGTVLRHPDWDVFKMWYHCYVGGRPDYFTCYATSEDGIHWERPEFNVVEDSRLTEPNKW